MKTKRKINKRKERSEMRGERRSITTERGQRTRKNDVRHEGRIKALEGRRRRTRALTEEVAGRSWPWYRPSGPCLLG
jgi:hypothetical protein